jgi:hypothetical protein
VVIGLVGILGALGVFERVPEVFGASIAMAEGVACKAPLIDSRCPPDYDAFEKASLESASSDGRNGCKFEFGFKELAEAEPKLVDKCTSKVYYDHFGNGVQYTKTGILFWQKESNTIYFYRGSSIWGFIQGHSQLLYGSGAI